MLRRADRVHYLSLSVHVTPYSGKASMTPRATFAVATELPAKVQKYFTALSASPYPSICFASRRASASRVTSRKDSSQGQ